MHRKQINAPDAPSTSGSYTQAIEVYGATRWLHVSGQIPVTASGDVPETFEAQCRLVWQNIGAQLAAANMTLDQIVKVTTFLSHRRHAETNSAVRREILGSNAPALTVIICGIYDEAWLLEIEVTAVA